MTHPNDLADMPGHLIRRLQQRATAVFSERMKAASHELTSVQFAALDSLHRHPGMDQATLAQSIAYDRATIGGVVKRLEQKGLVERPVADDRRARSLRLTQAGTEALAELTPVVAGLQEQILERLSEDERAIFVRLARKSLADAAEGETP